MSLHVDIGEDAATFVVAPEHGRTVVFEVRQRTVKVGEKRWYGPQNAASRYVVGLQGSVGDGFSTHVSFDTACSRALVRARRYERAYAKPRGVARPDRRAAA